VNGFYVDVRMFLNALASGGVVRILKPRTDNKFLGINKKQAPFSFWWQMYELIV